MHEDLSFHYWVQLTRRVMVRHYSDLVENSYKIHAMQNVIEVVLRAVEEPTRHSMT